MTFLRYLLQVLKVATKYPVILSRGRIGYMHSPCLNIGYENIVVEYTPFVC
jgi:hypothetical protein